MSRWMKMKWRDVYGEMDFLLIGLHLITAKFSESLGRWKLASISLLPSCLQRLTYLVFDPRNPQLYAEGELGITRSLLLSVDLGI